MKEIEVTVASSEFFPFIKKNKREEFVEFQLKVTEEFKCTYGTSDTVSADTKINYYILYSSLTGEVIASSFMCGFLQYEESLEVNNPKLFERFEKAQTPRAKNGLKRNKFL
jgi:hypothetical protein